MSNRVNFDDKFFKSAKRAVVLEVDDRDVDSLVERHYGRELELVADQELHNGSRLKWTFKLEKLSVYDQKRLDDFNAGKHVPYVGRIVMQDLVNRGIIPEASYLIDCSW
jgi:hypothetical protein